MSRSQYKKFSKESSRKKAKEGAMSVSNVKLNNSSMRNASSTKSPSNVVGYSNRMDGKSAKMGLSKSKR